MAAPRGNVYGLGNDGGRPPHYEEPQELHDKCAEYFVYCEEDKVKVTITGLALFLGFCSRSSFDDYAKRSEAFSYIIKRAKLAVSNSYENHGNAIDIFVLKNMGWHDKTVVEQTNIDKTPPKIEFTKSDGDE